MIDQIPRRFGTLHLLAKFALVGATVSALALGVTPVVDAAAPIPTGPAAVPASASTAAASSLISAGSGAAPASVASSKAPASSSVTTSAVSLSLADATSLVTSAPTRNFSFDPLLYATKSVYTSLLKFNTSKPGAGVTVVSAHLDLYTERLNNVAAGLTIHPASNNWLGTTVTAGKRPAKDTRTVSAAVLPKVHAITSIPLTDVSTISTTTTTSFEITYDQSNPDFAFDKQGVNAPKLVLILSRPAVKQAAMPTTPVPANAASASTSTSSGSTSSAPLPPTSTGATSASGASVSAGTSTPGLFFNLPARSTHKKPVFAVYFTPDPVSMDNAVSTNDWYNRNSLNPAGENGKWSFAGGLQRDRPIPQAPVSGDWKLANLETEVRQAEAAGLDGFEVDLMDFSSYNWTAALNLMQAAQNVDPSFKIMVMPDMGGAMNSMDETTIAKGLSTLAAYSSAYRNDAGNFVLAPFAADNKTPQFWTNVMNILSSTYGVNTAFLPILLNITSTFNTFAPISWGLTEWGVRDTHAVSTRRDYAAMAHALGKVWMAPIAVQDVRPRSMIYSEASNTELLRALWNQATTQNADLASMITWNDYSENTNFAPSANHGWSFLDINAYYMSLFQTGTLPAITTDALYITNRIQPYAAPYTDTAEKPMLLRGSIPTPARDTVEILTYLTAPATINVTVGTKKYSYTAAAGAYAQLYPLGLGYITATITRGTATGGAATTAIPVTNAPTEQDLTYYAVSSLRPNPQRR